ncbi:DNA gyrase inhibitor YacG [Litorimonas sp. RW-G-Af-16]|uniref:DNA gyrase inhibitor YacG n=1 Tax=Litorimonas sp. RW-G-Af-16 TaxID=3241168 RepID=UPI00390C6997
MSELCPICRRKDVTAEYKPFCSKRCADVDLHRWISGGYSIPTETPDETPTGSNDV